MTNLMRISVFILIVSIIFPILAYKLKPPKLLNSLEMKIAQFQEPSRIEIAEKKDLNEFRLDDPFKLSERAKISTQGDLAKKQLGIPYVSLIYQGKKRYVMLGDSIAKEGEKVGDYRIVKILHDKVLLRDKKGETIWLRLEE